ncbi:hypothetical protein [Sphingomicrobium clamense]|uniref:Uncharacterized protein n=1 Tax=Sphingomicrobium clamense TaxID=2851013 RepID=A0ABS6V639_9SPHN|nr:hypothetical protein [Sphingomicrobium sp. B8]MBW0145024.1 hypothetical protein [Sphingomicrobium sp. B8]
MDAFTESIFITIWIVLGLFMLRYLLTAVVGADRMGTNRKKRHTAGIDDAQIKELRQQVTMLTDRVKVLEKITVEDGNSLAAEIERLREPEQLGYGGADDLTAPQRSRNRV